jgi:hypothetical protein
LIDKMLGLYWLEGGYSELRALEWLAAWKPGDPPPPAPPAWTASEQTVRQQLERRLAAFVRATPENGQLTDARRRRLLRRHGLVLRPVSSDTCSGADGES